MQNPAGDSAPDTWGEQDNEMKFDGEESLPDVEVLAHPFGNEANRDVHEEYFDQTTEFFDGFLPQVPVSYYHNRDSKFRPIGTPIAIGVTAGRKYRNDGRWDTIKFFPKSKIPADVYGRLKQSLNDGTFFSSPTVVPDFHVVERNGHIKHWLTGSIAVLDAKEYRRPANWNAIGRAEMKSLFKAANLDFPSQLERDNAMAEGFTPRILFSKLTNWLKAELRIDDDAGEMTDEQKKLWGEVFGDESGDDDAADGKSKKGKIDPENSSEAIDENSYAEEMDELSARHEKLFGSAAKSSKDGGMPPQKKEKATMADKPNEPTAEDLRLEYENKLKAQDNQLKAVLQQNADLARRLDEKDMDTWFETVLQQGKVVPAEREGIVAMAMQMKADDVASSPTMKAADGKALTRLEAYKKSIEDRQPMLNLDGTMKGAGFDSGDAAKDKVSAQRKAELLQSTDMGATILKEQNGKR